MVASRRAAPASAARTDRFGGLHVRSDIGTVVRELQAQSFQRDEPRLVADDLGPLLGDGFVDVPELQARQRYHGGPK